MLRSWEDRFGAVVVGADRGELWLTVAAPPRTLAEAMPVAAEYWAFNAYTASEAGSVAEFAEDLVAATVWPFLWD